MVCMCTWCIAPTLWFGFVLKWPVIVSRVDVLLTGVCVCASNAGESLQLASGSWHLGNVKYDPCVLAILCN